MSGSKSLGKTVGAPTVKELLKQNPRVDGGQVREAQKLLKELRRDGNLGRGYEIVSPYERRPVHKPESAGKGAGKQ